MWGTISSQEWSLPVSPTTPFLQCLFIFVLNFAFWTFIDQDFNEICSTNEIKGRISTLKQHSWFMWTGVFFIETLQQYLGFYEYQPVWNLHNNQKYNNLSSVPKFPGPLQPNSLLKWIKIPPDCRRFRRCYCHCHIGCCRTSDLSPVPPEETEDRKFIW